MNKTTCLISVIDPAAAVPARPMLAIKRCTRILSQCLANLGDLLCSLSIISGCPTTVSAPERRGPLNLSAENEGCFGVSRRVGMNPSSKRAAGVGEGLIELVR